MKGFPGINTLKSNTSSNHTLCCIQCAIIICLYFIMYIHLCIFSCINVCQLIQRITTKIRHRIIWILFEKFQPKIMVYEKCLFLCNYESFNIRDIYSVETDVTWTWGGIFAVCDEIGISFFNHWLVFKFHWIFNMASSFFWLFFQKHPKCNQQQ